MKNNLSLTFLIISIINVCQCFKLQNNNNNINNFNFKATNTNRNDINDKDFKEIFKLSKSPDPKSEVSEKKGSDVGPNVPKRWGEILSPIDFYPLGCRYFIITLILLSS